jgi:hypothetical protein
MEQQDVQPTNGKYHLFGGMSTASSWLSLKHASNRLEMMVHMESKGSRGANLHDAGTPGSPLHLQGSHPELDFTPFQARQSAAHLLHPGRHGHCGLPQIYGLLPHLLQQKSLLCLCILHVIAIIVRSTSNSDAYEMHKAPNIEWHR